MQVCLSVGMFWCRQTIRSSCYPPFGQELAKDTPLRTRPRVRLMYVPPLALWEQGLVPVPELWQEREPVPSPSVRLLVRAPVQRALVQGFLSWACQMWRHSQVPVRALLPW